jgi:hypothetical protein
VLGKVRRRPLGLYNVGGLWPYRVDYYRAADGKPDRLEVRRWRAPKAESVSIALADIARAVAVRQAAGFDLDRFFGLLSEDGVMIPEGVL